MNNPIIEAFIVKKRTNRQLNWAGYISPFSNLETFLMSMDIDVNDDGIDDITSDESYPIVSKTVADMKKGEASTEVIEHDTYNIILIHRLRNKYPSSMLGSSVLLLTIDNKLPKVDRKLKRIYKLPHCRTIDQWGNLLLPFQNIGKFVATDEYISYLVSQQLGVAFSEKVLDIQFVRELEKSDIDIDGILKLDPEIALHSLIDLQEDREARTLLTEIEKAPEEEKDPIAKAFYERALSVISQYKEEEKRRDVQEIDRLQKGIQKLKDDLGELESAKTQDQARMKLVQAKLKDTQGELKRYKSMPFWQRVKFIFRGSS